MKKLILAAVMLGVASTGIENARAGDHKWAVAGKVLTGLVAASVITHAVQAEPCSTGYYYASPSPVCAQTYYAPPPVVFVQPPPPVVVYRTPVVCLAPPKVWVAPAPVFSVRFGFGSHHGHYHHW